MTDEQPAQDRRQLILPHVDTSLSIRGKTRREWMAYVPAGIGLFAALIAFCLDAMVIAGLLVGVSAIGLMLLGVHIENELAEAWYLTPRGVAAEFLSYRRFKRELPWSTDAAQRADLHNVRSMGTDGSYKRHDGSRVALLRIEGTNMDRMPAAKREARIRQLTDGIDEDLGPADQWWGFYSTTRPSTADPHALQREERATDHQTEIPADQREILADTAEWLREQDESVDASEWRQYAVVEVHPSDPAVALPNQSVGAQVRTAWSQLTTVVEGYVSKAVTVSEPLIERLPITTSDGEQSDATTTDSDESKTATPNATETPTDGAPIETVLARRVQLVRRAISRVEEVEIERASPAEHINILRAYWTNQGAVVGHAADGSPVSGGTDSLLRQACQRELTADGTTPTEQLLASGTFDIDGETVELGGDYVRTYWIADWPIRPSAMFLDELYTHNGIDLDVRVHATPVDRQTAADSIEETGLDVGAETITRSNAADFGTLEIDGAKELYEEAYAHLMNTNVDPWYLNAYVRVRAPDRATLDDACETIERRLQANPAATTPVAPTTSQRAALTSASPAGHDRYAEEARGDRRHLALSGAFGALFPFSSTDLSEADGIYWGRDTRTGEPVVADLFGRGRAPHITTIGETRSGKTTFAEDRCGDWYLGGDDRTLIVADMEAGFGGLTDVCGGEHILIDGDDSVNPWHIEPVAAARRRQTNDTLAPLAAQIDFVTELTMNIIRVGQPAGVVAIDPDLYRIARYAVGLTYDRAGITTDLDTHTNQSPTYGEFFDVLSAIRDNPTEHTIRGTEGEQAARREQADQLLESLLELTAQGRYSHLCGTGTTSLLADDVSMAYLDMPQLQGSSDAAKSIGLQLALHQIAQKIKRTPGTTIFVIDEAHVLYQSEKMIDWLAGAARRWARYDAAMWSISQSPEEFVKQQADTGANAENKRQQIFEQSSTMQAFYASNADSETLATFGLESPQQINAVQNSLTVGKSAGYSECLVSFDDQDGWLECRVETSPVTDAIEAITASDDATGTDGDTATETTAALPLMTIDGLDMDTASQLAADGIETRADLLATDAREVAALTNASGQQIDAWYNAALRRNGTARSDD